MLDSQLFVDARGLTKIYQTPAGDFPALKGIDLQINRGEFVAIIGKSGSGKSTLINLLTGIDRPTAGEVTIGGEAVHTFVEEQMAVWRGRHRAARGNSRGTTRYKRRSRWRFWYPAMNGLPVWPSPG
ncbi:MAG: ATP-binding cassette domain-containing protein [Chloroflexota bacterium]|jgi:predicted ABC-type transport system involved in lysophospholipase L1 biosynthesis ATPase subunit